jgi:hypothetical protein
MGLLILHAHNSHLKGQKGKFLSDTRSLKNRAFHSKSSFRQPATRRLHCGLYIAIAFALLVASNYETLFPEPKYPKKSYICNVLSNQTFHEK